MLQELVALGRSSTIVFQKLSASVYCCHVAVVYMVSAGRCDGMFAPTNPRK